MVVCAYNPSPGEAETAGSPELENQLLLLHGWALVGSGNKVGNGRGKHSPLTFGFHACSHAHSHKHIHTRNKIKTIRKLPTVASTSDSSISLIMAL